MELVPSFVELVKALGEGMTQPSYVSFLTLLTGWVFASRRTVTGMIQAADAVHKKHHSSYHRLSAKAQGSFDELGLKVFALLLPLLAQGIELSLDDALCRQARPEDVWSGHAP